MKTKVVQILSKPHSKVNTADACRYICTSCFLTVVFMTELREQMMNTTKTLVI